MCSATTDLQLCDFATLIQPPSREIHLVKKTFYKGGESKAQIRKVATSPFPNLGLGPACAGGPGANERRRDVPAYVLAARLPHAAFVGVWWPNGARRSYRGRTRRDSVEREQ